MFTLAFDTTAASCSVALLSDKKTVAKFSQKMDFGQAEVLIPQIKTMLDGQGWSFADLGLIVVCVGPGSFTGVRASISAARSFGVACPDLPIAGVSAFDAYLRDLADDELAVHNLVVIETKRDDFYFQIFDQKRNRVTAPSAGSREDILNLLKGGQKVTVTGDGTERFLYTPTGLSLHCIKMPTAADIKDIALSGIEQYEMKKINFPKPLYLRAPDVCLK